MNVPEYIHADGIDAQLRERMRAANRQDDGPMARRCSSIILDHRHVELAIKLLGGWKLDSAIIALTPDGGSM